MYKIFDAHTHTYPEKIAARAIESLSRFYNFKEEYDFEVVGKGTYAELAELAPENGIVGFLLFSVATNPGQVEKVNDTIAALAKLSCESGFKTIGFAGMHQDYPDFEKELIRCVDLGLRGVKIHPDIQGVDIDDARLFPLYKLIEGKMPLFLHMGDYRPQYMFSQPEKLAHILDKFPDLEVVAAHLGGYRSWDKAVEYLAGREKVWFDSSSALWAMSPEYAGEVMHKLGTDRIMFGTDYPVALPDEEINRLLAVDLTEKEREDIFYNNAARFFHLDDV